MPYTEKERKKIFKTICKRIMEGESLRDVLKDSDMPTRATFYKWINESEDIQNKYARATTARADYVFDQILEIADKQGADMLIIDGVEVVNHNVIQRNRLQVDARKWIISKMNPKKYGEKVDITTGNKPITPQETTVTFINARKDKED